MKYTTDIWFASYLMRKGREVADLETANKRTKLGFAMTEDEWRMAKIDWAKSPEIDIKYTQEKIKDLIFQ